MRRLQVGIARFVLIAVALFVATRYGSYGVLAGAAVLTLLTPPVHA